MRQNPVPWRSIIRLIPKTLFFAVILSVLFVVALLLAAFGRRTLLNHMLSTFRRWHLLAPKTDEEKDNHIVWVVNSTYMTHGFGFRRFIWHILWRSTGRKFVGHFLEDEMKELTGVFSGNFLHEAAKKDDLGLVIAVTSLLDKYIGALIVIRFLVSISKRDYERIFSGYGPVASFSSKIAMGTALGLLFGDMAHDLAVLKKIRNDFAHGIKPLNLSVAPYSSLCRSLKMSQDLNKEIIEACGTDERRRIVASVATQILYMTVVLQRGIVERQFVQEHSAEIGELTKQEMAKVREKSRQGAGAT